MRINWIYYIAQVSEREKESVVGEGHKKEKKFQISRASYVLYVLFMLLISAPYVRRQATELYILIRRVICCIFLVYNHEERGGKINLLKSILENVIQTEIEVFTSKKKFKFMVRADKSLVDFRLVI